MASVADLNDRMDLAVAAIDAETWSTADRHLLAAKAILAALPSGAATGFVTTWNGSAIDDLLDRVRKKAAVVVAWGMERSRDVAVSGLLEVAVDVRIARASADIGDWRSAAASLSRASSEIDRWETGSDQDKDAKP